MSAVRGKSDRLDTRRVSRQSAEFTPALDTPKLDVTIPAARRDDPTIRTESKIANKFLVPLIRTLLPTDCGIPRKDDSTVVAMAIGPLGDGRDIPNFEVIEPPRTR